MSTDELSRTLGGASSPNVKLRHARMAHLSSNVCYASDQRESRGAMQATFTKTAEDLIIGYHRFTKSAGDPWPGHILNKSQ